MCREKQSSSFLICLSMKVFFFAGILFSVGCAYHWGSAERRIPGEYRTISVPVFKNKTKEVSAESYFTNALIREIESSGVGTIVEKKKAEVVVEGVIELIEYRPESLVNSTDFATLPTGAVLATDFRMTVKAHIKVFRSSDGQSLWQGSFTGERLFPVAQLAVRGVNTVNPLYNHSAKKQNLILVAREMMDEAYDRMTENF